MKKSLKSLMVMFFMIIAFAMTGIVSNAAEATYTPTTVTNLNINPSLNIRNVTVPANSSIVIPIKIPAKGGIWLYYNGGGNYNLLGRIYTDVSCTTLHTIIGYFDSSTSMKDVIFDKAGTYYLKIENDNRTSTISGNIGAYFFNGADKTLTSGKTNVTFQNSSTTWVYHKFKATKTGYISVNIQEAEGYGVYAKLLSSSKKALSNEIYTYQSSSIDSSNIASFAVQKGKTYYIATRGSSEGETYNITCTQKSVSEKSGTKKSKAVTIKKNKTIKGTQIANGKKTGNDWYKIKLTSAKKITFTIGGKTTGYGDIKIKVVPASSKVRLYSNTMSVPETGNAKYTTIGKWPKGTYYIQVYKYNKNSSGYYSIKWK